MGELLGEAEIEVPQQREGQEVEIWGTMASSRAEANTNVSNTNRKGAGVRSGAE